MADQPTLESIRQAHEDLERLSHLGAAALALSSGADVDAARIPEEHPSRESARSAEHLAAALAACAVERARALRDGYAADGLESAAGGKRDPAAVLSAFYEALRDVKALHRVDSAAPWDGRAADSALLAFAPPPPSFSGEEGGGRYLDLQEHFAKYLNISQLHVKPGVANGKRSRKRARNSDALDPAGAKEPGKVSTRRIDYREYVEHAVSDPSSVSVSVRGTSAYEKYLAGVLEYLVSFAEKLHPLADVRELVKEAESSLHDELLTSLNDLASLSPEAILERLGPEEVKNKLLAVGSKCGGRPLDRAKRLRERAAAFHNTQGPQKASLLGNRAKLERLIQHVLSELLAEERRRTVINVEKKQSLSWAELEAERVVEEAIAERSNVNPDGDNEDDDEKPLYNPKGVPLGWDGKPIPFWLYKLHGLNHEFRCEICGGTSYKGPRAFERHFTDAQHIHGLRCLNISYSKHYYMVDRIADAVRLRDKIACAGKNSSFDPDLEMEFEDSTGNVMNRKTYQDLERQGLLS